MPETIDELDEADRADFLSRIGVFGLDDTAAPIRSLTTTPSTVTTLSTRSDVVSQYRPTILRTNDLDKLDEWIGIPNRVWDESAPVVDVPPRGRDSLFARLATDRISATTGRTGRARARQAPRAANVEAAQIIDTDSLSSTDLSEVRTAARAYLRGDSRLLGSYKSVIEKVFPSFEIPLWQFFNITVQSGSVLEFGPGPHALVAYSITIEDGGIIRSHGDLSVSATILRRTKPSVFHPIDPALIAIRRFGSAIFEA